MNQIAEISLKKYTISLIQFENLVSEFEGKIENEGPVCYNFPVVVSFKNKSNRDDFILNLEAYRYV